MAESAGRFGEGFLAAAEGGMQKHDHKQQKSTHTSDVSTAYTGEGKWLRGDTAGCMISGWSLGSGWRKASEPRGKMAWPWCYGDLMVQHRHYLSFLFISNLQGGGGKSKLFQSTFFVASCKAGRLNLQIQGSLEEPVAASWMPCSSPRPGLYSHVGLHETRSGTMAPSAAMPSAGNSD